MRTRPQMFLLRFARLAAVVVMLIGVVALAGWALNNSWLTSWAGLAEMRPVPAILFIGCGAGLCMSLKDGGASIGRSVTRLLTGAAVILGSVNVVCFVAGVSWEFDEAIRGTGASQGLVRLLVMAPNTALNFVLCGLGLTLIDVQSRFGFRPSQAAFLGCGLISLLALMGHASRILSLSILGEGVPMALNTAFAFLVLSLGGLAARPDQGVMSVVTSDSAAGAMARRLLPASVLLPLILGGLRFLAERHGYLSVDFGLALFAVANMVLFTGLIWWNAQLLFRAEREQARAEEQLKRASNDLARSNTDLQQFAYVASHDLSEPLRMVVSYLELLSSRHGDELDAEAREFIGYATDGARRLQQLIGDLLEYSRVDSRGREFEQVDLGHAVSEALANLKLRIEETGATVEQEPLPTIRGDRSQLTRVFQNLIGNALKFRSAAPPRIVIGANRRNGEWVLRVQDNGIGIDPRNADRVFVLFQRLHTRKEYPGTGMGLAICKRIVERHGGRIWVEPTPGGGSTFFFSLPADA